MLTLKTHSAAIGVLGMDGRLMKANTKLRSPSACQKEHIPLVLIKIPHQRNERMRRGTLPSIVLCVVVV